ncbi:MAG: hypothetical protein IJW51_03515 [Clostridia bacterium]|nr:hypothetical protein [Clostridia bacterium]
MKLLFIGNSHTYYNDLVATVLALLEATGERSHGTMLTRGGKTLTYHMADPATAFNIKYGGYDLVIAQDRASVFDTALFEEGAAALKAMADAAGARFMLYMPWALRDNREAQHDMTESYLAFCRANDCRFAPAGETFTRLLATEAPDTIYREDGNHATPLGSYAAAVTLFYTITGRKRTVDPTKINDPGIAAGYSPELCRRIHADACHVTRLFNG